MKKLVLKNGRIINEGKSVYGDVLIIDERIEKIDAVIDMEGAQEIDCTDKWIIPGIIDDQVHFREPGLTHKADIYSESRAAVAGGVTTFMEMPNTRPAAVTSDLLEEKYEIARSNAWCNYSFFMGTTNGNFDEIQSIDFSNVCGLKIFMGSSTGNMLVDDETTLNKIFRDVDALIATHCEDEKTIKDNFEKYYLKYGEQLSAEHHALIRDENACYKSSSFAVDLAKKYNSRLHVLHISTEDELSLFANDVALESKRITSEVCVHHLTFTAEDYARLGNNIKCNPAIKAAHHAPKLLQAMLDDRLDIIATDHAPHTMDEKNSNYINAPSGLPLIQHSFDLMMNFVNKGKMTVEKVIEKMCHAPAICFKIVDRGYIRENYYADIAIYNPKSEWKVDKNNLLYKCGWSPLEDMAFNGKIESTFVNGKLIYNDGEFYQPGCGHRLKFVR